MAKEIVPFTATGAGEMSETISSGCLMKVVNVQLKLSVAGGASEDFVASTNGIPFLSQDMNTATSVEDYHEHHVASSGTATFTYTNTNSRTWTLYVFYQLLD